MLINATCKCMLLAKWEEKKNAQSRNGYLYCATLKNKEYELIANINIDGRYFLRLKGYLPIFDDSAHKTVIFQHVIVKKGKDVDIICAKC